MIDTASPRHFLLIRRLLSRPDQLTFYLRYAPPGTPATITYFITIAGRRWPVEETLKTGKDVLGWDRCRPAPGKRSADTPRCQRLPSSARQPSATPCAA
jgi:hypothetical protein